MRIVFLLQSLGICGGVRVVFEHANRLQERGHEVYVVHPILPPSFTSIKWWFKFYSLKRLYGRTQSFIKRLMASNSVDWFPLKVKLLKAPTFNEKYIPKADVIVATWWETAYEVKKYSPDKGEKFYLIQHYEIWGGPEDEVNTTYRLGLHNIVVSNWIKNILEEKLDVKVEAVIPNGINLTEFFPEKIKRKNEKLRILLPYRSQEWKGIKDGLAACEIAKQKHPNIQIVMFGPKPEETISPEIEFHNSPHGGELRKIYNSCDIFVFPSHCEGFGLPPMEAMACKLAVVTTEVGGVPDYTIPGQTALVSKPRDIDSLAQNILKLIENPLERERIAENGYKYIQNFGWEKATDKLEKIFQKYTH